MNPSADCEADDVRASYCALLDVIDEYAAAVAGMRGYQKRAHLLTSIENFERKVRDDERRKP